MNKNKGFTLIELLVVIAIIGILSSVVLASLNSARNKGSDAAIKANLANARAQAELYADDNSGSYDNVCDVDNGIKKAKDAASTTASGDIACTDDVDGWALSAKLKASSDYWCVDSSGFSGATSSNVSTTTCS